MSLTAEQPSNSLDLDLRPLAGRIGAEIIGVDLHELGDGVPAAIRAAVLTHRVVFFRGQQLSEDEHRSLAGSLGTVTLGHPTLPVEAGHREVFDLDSLKGASANHWHTDVTFVDRPPAFSILRSLTIPPVGGDTVWANTVAAYEDLPLDLKVLADSIRAVHTNGQDYGRVDVKAAKEGSVTKEEEEYLTDFVSTVFETEHPVVSIHPETGERALLLGGFASRIVGHSTAESVDILRTLQAYVTRPENTVRWKWTEGDVVIWDNRSTQHYAINDYRGAARRVQRMTTLGERIVGVEGATSRAIKGDATYYYSATSRGEG
jgi:taurine dioxygenase